MNFTSWHGAVTLFVYNMSFFRGVKDIKGVIWEWSSEGALKFEFYMSDWHLRGTQFSIIVISNTTSDRDLTPPLLPGGI